MVSWLTFPEELAAHTQLSSFPGSMNSGRKGRVDGEEEGKDEKIYSGTYLLSDTIFAHFPLK